MYWKNKIKTAAETSKNFLIFLFHRAQNDTILRVSASLSYTSLIAIVPLFAIGLAIFSAFPGFTAIKEQFQDFILKNFVPDIEQEISHYFVDFLNATAQMTTIGVVGLVITSILMLSTIENSLNFIFKVYKPRNIKTKITLYWTVITLGPLLLGAAFSLRSYLFTLQKFMPEEIVDSPLFLSDMVPSLITMFALIMVYVLVPNKKVKISNAIIGAFISVILFWFLRKGFGLIILQSSTYKTIYGALAALPIFLIWMYLAWAVVIFGAVVTAALDEFQDKENEEEKDDKTISYIKRIKKRIPHRKKPLQKEQK